MATTSVTRPATPPRYDPLAEFNRPALAPVDLRKAGRTFMGFVLMCAGIGLCGWVVYLIHAAIFRPEKLAMLTRLLPSKPEDLTITVPSGKIEYPGGWTTIVAYFLLILLIGIVGRIATALVREGSWLVRYDRLADAAPESPAHDAPAPPPPV